MTSLKQHQSGYTLLELLVSLIVGAILVGSLSTAVNNQTYLSQRAKGVTIANSYVENKVEELRSRGYLAIADGTTNLNSELPTTLPAPRTGSLVVSSSTAGVKTVDITISYNEQGKQRTYAYKTYIGELGVGQY